MNQRKRFESAWVAAGFDPDRVRYEADMLRYLIGEITERPDILNYDANKHSGYKPLPEPPTC